jgi:hypothetical protein
MVDRHLQLHSLRKPLLSFGVCGVCDFFYCGIYGVFGDFSFIYYIYIKTNENRKKSFLFLYSLLQMENTDK